MYGLAVVGLVDPDAVWTKAGAQPGDVLYLTKPLGTGLLVHGAKEGRVRREALAEAVGWMKTLNARAAELIRPCAPNAVTDVTGFGLIGHAFELAGRSGVRVELDADALPALPGSLELAAAGVRTGGDPRNRAYVGDRLAVDGAGDAQVALGFDPQTAGGLLVSPPPKRGARARAVGRGRRAVPPAGRRRRRRQRSRPGLGELAGARQQRRLGSRLRARAASLHDSFAARVASSPASIASIAASDEEPICRRAAAHAAGSSAARSVASSSATGRPIAASAAADEARRRQRRRRLARLDEVADGPADDLVRAAVVEAALEREDVGDVGRGDEALARDLLEARRPQLDPVQHGRRQPRDRDRLVERPRDRAVQEVEVVGASRAGVQRRERGSQVAGSLAGLRADRGERVRVLLLRHQRARAAVRVGELDEPELLARVDLEVLAELALVRGRDRERREQLDVDVRLPGRVLRVLDQRRRSRAARRAASRSSAQREPALPPAPATLAPSGRVDARTRSASRSAG